MLKRVFRNVAGMARVACFAVSLCAVVAWASVGGSISGTIADPDRKSVV